LLKKSSLSEAEGRAFLREQLDLVALGTIADVVPLLGENRVLARNGMEALMATRRPGLRALMEIAGVKNRGISADIVGFGLGPRLNAAGRTDDATLALKLLMATDAAEGQQIAQRLEQLNRERREMEDETLQASLLEAEILAGDSATNALVVGGIGWHLGVVGIVASRLTDRFDMPAIVLAIENDVAKGSARSVPGFDLHGALAACDEHLLSWGGHAAAAGLRLTANRLPSFRAALNHHAGVAFEHRDRTRTINLDAEVAAGDLTWDLYRDMMRLQPFGEGNPAPVFLMRNVSHVGDPRIVGRNHLKVKLQADGCVFEGIGFSQGHLKELFTKQVCDIAFKPMENVWNGMSRLEVELVDGRAAERD